MDDREIVILLNFVDVGSLRLQKFKEFFGDLRAVLKASRQDLAAIESVSANLAEKILLGLRQTEKLENELARCQKLGVTGGLYGQPETPLARVAQAAHRLAACLQRSKSAAGLADAEVRHGTGWHHHHTLSLSATWVLVTATRRGKKWTPALTLPHMRAGIALILSLAYQCGTMSRLLHERARRLQRNELARFYYWKQQNRLPPLNLDKRRF